MDSHNKDPQYTHLDSRVSHLDVRVNSLSEDMSSVKTSVDSMSNQLGQLIQAVNTQPPTNWVGIGSLILAMMVGGAGFVSLRVSPLEHRDATTQSSLETLHDFRHEMHYEVGVFRSEKDQIASEVSRLWEHIHKQEEIDREQDQHLAELGTSARATEDLVKKMDEQGTHWGNSAAKEAALAFGRLQSKGVTK